MTEVAERPTKKQIKTVHRSLRNAYNNDEEKQKEWKEIRERDHLDEAYGKDDHHNSAIGKKAAHHILDSDAFRQQLTKHTPSNYPSIIPDDSDFNFWFIKEVHPDGTKIFEGIDLSEYELLMKCDLSQCFEDNIDKMKNIFDEGLYTSKLTVTFGNQHHIWVKSIKKSGSAFVRYFGIEVTSCIMRFRWAMCFAIGDGMMVLCGKNLNVLIGGGFCNLEQSKKQVKGHGMIQFEEENMDKISIEFYRKKDDDTSVRDLCISVMTYNIRRNQLVPTRDAPLVLFDGDMDQQIPSNDLFQNASVYDNGLSIFPDGGSMRYMQSPVMYMQSPPITESMFMPLINEDNGINERSYAPYRYNNRIFQDVNGFGDLRNGIHRRSWTDRRGERASRNDAHIQQNRNGFM